MAESIRDRAQATVHRDPGPPAAVPGTPTSPERALVEHGVALSLVGLLAEWLPRQRWFAGKDRPVSEVRFESVTELLPYRGGGKDAAPADGRTPPPGLLHLLLRVEQPGPVADVYQLLLGLRPAPLPPRLAPWSVGVATDGPLHGAAVYDALGDPRLAAVLLERLRLPGRLGSLVFSREPGVVIPSGLDSRPLAAEQSNSSVVYGDQLILKVFRRVYAGSNPDLELPLALARAGCACAPAPAAWFETVDVADADDGPATLGVLQPFLTGSTDGWELALAAAARGDAWLDEARALGRATADVHLALARVLPTMVLRRPQVEHLTELMTERLDATAAAVPALLPYRDALAAGFARLAALGERGRTWAAQRIHGDLHLGQALHTPAGDRWTIIDFEGEPARPLPERRRPQPPARDVAGMLRSFDYAARSADAGLEWARGTREAYCDGYAAAAGSDPREEPELLAAYEADKAVYEVLYEARHRPDWLDVPMSAIRRLAV